MLDTLVITVLGHDGHYRSWTRWSLPLLDTLVITVVVHVDHYRCWTRWSLPLLDTLVITVVGHVGHYYCCTRWSLLLLDTCFGVLMLDRLFRTAGKLLELELHVRVWHCSPRILLKLLEEVTFTLFRNVGNYQSAFHNIPEQQRFHYNAAEVSNPVSVCS